MKRVLSLALLALVGCGSSAESASERGICGRDASTLALTVVTLSYDDVSGETACQDGPVSVYASTAAERPAPGGTGIVPQPTSEVIAKGRTNGRYVDFSLPPGEFTVCSDGSCGHVTLLEGRRMHAAFVGGPSVSWETVEAAND